jgi:hypothetical protein
MTRSDREYGKARKPSHVEVLRKKIEMEANWSLIAAAMEGRAAQGPHATER